MRESRCSSGLGSGFRLTFAVFENTHVPYIRRTSCEEGAGMGGGGGGMGGLGKGGERHTRVPVTM